MNFLPVEMRSSQDTGQLAESGLCGSVCGDGGGSTMPRPTGRVPCRRCRPMGITSPYRRYRGVQSVWRPPE